MSGVNGESEWRVRPCILLANSMFVCWQRICKSVQGSEVAARARPDATRHL